jgi:hypothetical protein
MIRILISGDNTLFNLNKGRPKTCITTTEEIFENFRTIFVTKEEFYTTVMNISSDIDNLPDINLYYNLGTNGYLVGNCRQIKPHIVICNKGDSINRLLVAPVKIEISQLEKTTTTAAGITNIKYFTHFNGSIEIVPDMVTDDLVSSSKFPDPHLKNKLFVPRRYSAKAECDYMIDGEWIPSVRFGVPNVPHSYIDEFVKLVIRRVASDLLLGHILTVTDIDPGNKILEVISRIDTITAELSELKKQLEKFL